MRLGAGYLVAQVFTSRGAIPIEVVSVTVTFEGAGRELMGFRSTDLSGRTKPILLEAPDRAQSEHPNQGKPFSSYTLTADHPLYYSVQVNNVQIFDGETSVQRIELIPLEENSQPDQRLQSFSVTPQNL